MNRKYQLFAAGILCSLFFANNSNAQITTSNALTPTQLVQNVLLGPGIIASNITFTGYSNAIGEFWGGNSGTPVLGIDSGIVMTNGTILLNDPTYGSGAGPMGPNSSTGAGVDNGQPGDAYLNTVANCNTFNAAVLEFDFIAQADSVKFNYVFGTDEYMEYVSGGFADVFAFVLSGVSVTLAPTNIALIPSTTTPVTALNVNANVNPAYYVDNENPPGTT
ncbi:MAG TPA: choice-of-anchor L domain-containing protein, partial [Bacteroidia bacterium]|nr:choice-of-anchor L domain-containing protein [Bacteroidia bacterium]